jgi:chromosome segregation ATPase
MNDLSEQYNSSFSAFETRLVSLSARLKSTRIERDSLAAQLSSLKSSNSSLQASLNDSKKESESLQRNIERLKLELEGKDRDTKEMREQVKGWQRLEGKGNEEIDAERAKRVGLEVELKVEKDRVKEGKKRIKELLVCSISFDTTSFIAHSSSRPNSKPRKLSSRKLKWRLNR